MKILKIFVLLAITSTAAAEKKEENFIKFTAINSYILYEHSYKKEWRKLTFSNATNSFELFKGEKNYFDKSSESDFSKGREYLLINKIVRGHVTDNSKSEEYEKYYCSFVDMRTGCIVREETGYFCAGNWSDESGYWNLDGENILIDIRLDKKANSQEIFNAIKSISDTNNYKICFP